MRYTLIIALSIIAIVGCSGSSNDGPGMSTYTVSYNHPTTITTIDAGSDVVSPIREILVPLDGGSECGYMGCPIRDNSGLGNNCQEYMDNIQDCIWCGDAAATCILYNDR